MQSQTRDILNETMIREWVLVWTGAPGLRPADYKFTGTAQDAVDDFRSRFPFVPILASKIVMDDGEWTIRLTFADQSVATVFVG